MFNFLRHNKKIFIKKC